MLCCLFLWQLRVSSFAPLPRPRCRVARCPERRSFGLLLDSTGAGWGVSSAWAAGVSGFPFGVGSAIASVEGLPKELESRALKGCLFEYDEVAFRACQQDSSGGDFASPQMNPAAVATFTPVVKACANYRRYQLFNCCRESTRRR